MYYHVSTDDAFKYYAASDLHYKAFEHCCLFNNFNCFCFCTYDIKCSTTVLLIIFITCTFLHICGWCTYKTFCVGSYSSQSNSSNNYKLKKPKIRLDLKNKKNTVFKTVKSAFQNSEWIYLYSKINISNRFSKLPQDCHILNIKDG